MAKGNDNAAGIYAQALFEAARDGGVITQVQAELSELAETLATNFDSARGAFFDSPAVGFEDKARIYRKAFEGRIHPLLLSFILTTAKHGRSPSMFKQVAFYLRELTNTQDGIAELEVRSARKLEMIEMEKLKATLSKKLNLKVHVTEKVEPELMGGFVVLHQNQQWDASVSSRLDRLKKELKEAKFPSTVLKD